MKTPRHTFLCAGKTSVPTIRMATQADVAAMLTIKAALELSPETEAKGGFLLGTSEETYLQHIEKGEVWVLTSPSCVAGFAVVWRDNTLKKSELFEKRHGAKFLKDPGALLELPIAYFDQLAVLPDSRHRAHGKSLALYALLSALKSHPLVLATTVSAPISNRAATPFLRAAGFEMIGSIDEVYPGVGAISSTLHLLNKGVFLEQSKRFRPLKRQLSRLSYTDSPERLATLKG